MRKTRTLQRFFQLTILFVTSTGCSAEYLEAPGSANQTPIENGDGWQTAAPASVDLDTAKLALIYDFIQSDIHEDFHSLVVVKDKKLVIDRYYNGYDLNSTNDIRSATKSITSALVGLAIEDGYIEGLDTKILTFLQDYAPFAHDSPQKQAVTIENLLTMASGFDANADDAASPGHEDRLFEADDWIRFCLDVPMANEPGEVWAYTSMNTFLLGAIIAKASNETLQEYSHRRLFQPLGMKNYRWSTTPRGDVIAQGNFFITARDMAKIGSLYLNDGRWGEAQVLPADWVKESLKGRYPVSWDGYDQYGYQWYTHSLSIRGKSVKYYLASGNGGNKIYVIPEHRMVVAIASSGYNRGHSHPRSLAILRMLLLSVNET